MQDGLDLDSTNSEWATDANRVALHVRGVRSIEMQATSERGRESLRLAALSSLYS